MDNVLKRYYQLILKDKKYLKEYIFNDTHKDEMFKLMQREMEELFIWRKANSYAELKTIVKGKRRNELLIFSDYYDDQMCELLEQYLGINLQELDDKEFDNILSDDNLGRIAKDRNTPKQLKACIMLEMESKVICRDMYKYIMQN